MEEITTNKFIWISKRKNSKNKFWARKKKIERIILKPRQEESSEEVEEEIVLRDAQLKPISETLQKKKISTQKKSKSIPQPSQKKSKSTTPQNSLDKKRKKPESQVVSTDRWNTMSASTKSKVKTDLENFLNHKGYTWNDIQAILEHCQKKRKLVMFYLFSI